MLELDAPLGFNFACAADSNNENKGKALISNIHLNRKTLHKIIEILDIPDRNGKMHFPEVIFPLMFTSFGISNKELLSNDLTKKLVNNL